MTRDTKPFLQALTGQTDPAVTAATFTDCKDIDIISTADKASELFKSKDVSRCNVDATGVGAGVAPQMQRNGSSATAVKVASKPTQTTELGEFALLRDQLWWSAREWLRADPGSMLPPELHLL